MHNNIKKNDTKIAGNKTIRDWLNLKEKIDKDSNNEKLWDEAFEFFKKRVFTRYIEPAEDIMNNICSKDLGEGFTISTILCSLIEALETFHQGMHFTPGKPQNKYEYTHGQSKAIFTSFLTKRDPFKDVFNNKNLAEDFYSNVRCALLHEAATRNGWVIRVDTEKLVEMNGNKKILNRNKFLEAIKNYIESYRRELTTNAELKQAFVRKMNSICNTA